MNLATHYAFVGPALAMPAGALVFGWLFIRERHPKAGE
jgi:uncharacterized protein (TIGR03382 family)